MDQDSAQGSLENHILALKNMKRNNESKGIPKKMELSLKELENKKSGQLRELQKDLQELTISIKAVEEEQEKIEEHLKRESILIAQRENIATDKAREVKMRNEFKLQYDQRLMKASSKPSSKDLELIENYKKKLRAYRKLTGVLWDYPSCNENRLSGYIHCGDKLKLFHLDISGKSRDSRVNDMWGIIEKYNALHQDNS